MFRNMESVKQRRQKFVAAVSYASALVVNAQKSWNFLISP